MSQTIGGEGLPPVILERAIRDSGMNMARLQERSVPETLPALAEAYEALGKVISTAEACLISALDALDPKLGDGPASPAEPYKAIKKQALGLLEQSGALFAQLERAFAGLVHGSGGWSCQPVAGDAITLYQNTFKKNHPLSPEERHEEYQQRVEKFLGAGGSFSDIKVLTEPRLESLHSRARYDYVMLPDYTTRIYPTTEEARKGKPKAGHSLLVGEGADFQDKPILLAGEMWVLKDSMGDVEVVVVANNSGHFKPAYRDLPNAVPCMEQLGVPVDRVVLFGGPNNIPAIFREMEAQRGLQGLRERLAPAPETLLTQWRQEVS